MSVAQAAGWVLTFSQPELWRTLASESQAGIVLGQFPDHMSSNRSLADCPDLSLRTEERLCPTCCGTGQPPASAMQISGGISWKRRESARPVLEPVIARYRERGLPLYFRGHAAFAKPELYQLLEAEGIGYAIRLPANSVLQERIGHLLTRPVGRPPTKPQVFFASFSYQAQSWARPRRVVAKMGWTAPVAPVCHCTGRRNP